MKPAPAASDGGHRPSWERTQATETAAVARLNLNSKALSRITGEKRAAPQCREGVGTSPIAEKPASTGTPAPVVKSEVREAEEHGDAGEVFGEGQRPDAIAAAVA